jgi:hypothetical protein
MLHTRGYINAALTFDRSTFRLDRSSLQRWSRPESWGHATSHEGPQDSAAATESDGGGGAHSIAIAFKVMAPRCDCVSRTERAQRKKRG